MVYFLLLHMLGSGHSNVVRILTAHGADGTIIDGEGYVAAQRAFQVKSFNPCVSMLISTATIRVGLMIWENC